ncbi:MAG TPA: transposase, partial [Burkholderiales bacterium]|nr:transposase [Burkholderiales bacterium]
REHVTFVALCGDQGPHFTTIAGFIRTLDKDIANVFAQVLFICDAQGLIGREMFAIDGVKLPSNASKARSGTRADFQRQAAKLEATAQKMLARHRADDAREQEPDLAEKDARRIERLQRDAAEIRQWLAKHPKECRGVSGAIVKSNRTDNESAKMATGKGVMQGYTGMAAVDRQHQIIVEAQAHGSGGEQALLTPVIDAMRKRDERFAAQSKHKAKSNPLHNKSSKQGKPKRYQPADFVYDATTQTCVCPAGKQLYRNGSRCVINGYAAVKFQGAQRDCLPCSHRDRCLSHPARTKTRQVAFFQGRIKDLPEPKPYTAAMKQRIDSDDGRRRYGERFATVEPVFGNLRHNKRLNRFTLRGRAKVDTQWKLYCLVHNIEKLAHYGYAH